MKTAILITYDKKDSISEATALCEAANYKITKTILQDFLNRPKFGISEEKAEELKELKENLNPDIIIYDEILKPSQNYNLASKLKIEILDRQALILEIFESRATSAESKFQTKLAQLRYEMSRAKEKVRLARMGEQPGFMGIGKFEVEVYYNDIKHRMKSVKSKLSKAGKQRELHRQSRKRLGFRTLSLAGYTSAGKTTLFNLLTGEDKEQSKKLFTTLTTTTRKIIVNRKPVLLSDTVGFISKLPAYMIEAFKSTLEELTYADVVLLVLDISDEENILKKKFQSCSKTLFDLGVQPNKLIFIFNKSDLVESSEIISKAKFLQINDSKWISISSTKGRNIPKLRELIDKMLETKTLRLKDSLKQESDKIYGF